MKWISINDQEPPKKDILVMLEECNTPHVVMYYDPGHCLIERCLSGTHFDGRYIETFITHWAELPEPPPVFVYHSPLAKPEISELKECKSVGPISSCTFKDLLKESLK